MREGEWERGIRRIREGERVGERIRRIREEGEWERGIRRIREEGEWEGWRDRQDKE